MTHPIANFLAFQICWFANVLGAAQGIPWLGPWVAMTWLAAHGLSCSSDRHVELSICASVGLLGYVADSALVLSGLLDFPEHGRLGAPSPVWMVALWVGFAMTLRHSLGWLRGHYALGAALGALFGPLAYFAGAKLGAIVLVADTTTLMAVAVEWMVAMPLALAATARFETSLCPLSKPNHDAGEVPQ